MGLRKEPGVTSLTRTLLIEPSGFTVARIDPSTRSAPALFISRAGGESGAQPLGRRLMVVRAGRATGAGGGGGAGGAGGAGGVGGAILYSAFGGSVVVVMDGAAGAATATSTGGT